MKIRWRRGVALTQTLVMSVILSMIAAMIMKWVLARYMLAARNYRAVAAKGSSAVVTGQEFSRWGFGNPPANGSVTTADGVTVDYRRNNIPGLPYFRITVTVDQD